MCVCVFFATKRMQLEREEEREACNERRSIDQFLFEEGRSCIAASLQRHAINFNYKGESYCTISREELKDGDGGNDICSTTFARMMSEKNSFDTFRVTCTPFRRE